MRTIGPLCAVTHRSGRSSKPGKSVAFLLVALCLALLVPAWQSAVAGSGSGADDTPDADLQALLTAYPNARMTFEQDEKYDKSVSS